MSNFITPYMNASGCPGGARDDLDKVSACPYSCAVILKTCTLEPNIGNGNKCYGSRDGVFLNAVGLSNAGLKYSLKLHGFYDRPSRPCIISVTPEVILKHPGEFYAKYVEVNISCPNAGTAPIAYNMTKFAEFIKELHDRYDLLKYAHIGLKLPPYTLNMEKIIRNICAIINKCEKGLISWITCCNTIPHAYAYDPSKRAAPLISTGYAAMSGPAIKPICLSNVRMYYKYLRKDIEIIGSGGVRTGRDVYEYILSGCAAVQIGSGIIDEGIDIFKKVNQELSEIMKKYNVHSLSDIRGRAFISSKM